MTTKEQAAKVEAKRRRERACWAALQKARKAGFDGPSSGAGA